LVQETEFFEKLKTLVLVDHKTSQACCAFEPGLLLLDQASAQQISKINLKKNLFELGLVKVQVVLAFTCCLSLK
jgi:hypothetical protein